MGLTSDQFFALTPRQYDSLLDRHYEQQKHTEWLTGVVASAVANFRFGRPEESPTIRPQDFALPLLLDPKANRRKPINRKRVAEEIRGEFDRAMRVQKMLAPKPPRD